MSAAGRAELVPLLELGGLGVMRSNREQRPKGQLPHFRAGPSRAWTVLSTRRRETVGSGRDGIARAISRLHKEMEAQVWDGQGYLRAAEEILCGTIRQFDDAGLCACAV